MKMMIWKKKMMKMTMVMKIWMIQRINRKKVEVRMKMIKTMKKMIIMMVIDKM